MSPVPPDSGKKPRPHVGQVLKSKSKEEVTDMGEQMIPSPRRESKEEEEEEHDDGPSSVFHYVPIAPMDGSEELEPTPEEDDEIAYKE